MPELPEVETVVRFLQPQLTGRVFQSAFLPPTYERAIANYSIDALNKQLRGQMINAVSRRAKFIVLECDAGILCIHLRMTGRILLSPPDEHDQKYVTAWFTLTDGGAFYFKDVRKFGRIYWYPNPAEFHATLGVEPLSAQFTAQKLKTLLAGRRRAIKPLLLDQKYVVGIGNIYADEVLWASRIHPATPANTLGTQALALIHANTRTILQASIERNGTTFQSFYFGEEASGEFKSLLKVFGKQGEPCPRCATQIEKMTYAQRGTHFCPTCQQDRRNL